MAKICSTTGIPADIKAIYAGKKSPEAKLEYIKIQLDAGTVNTAAWKHSQLISQINSLYPGYVDTEDEAMLQGNLFTSTDPDAAAQGRQQAEAQAKQETATAPLTAKPKVKEKPVEKAPVAPKTRRPKRSAAPVAKGEQPASTSQTGSGTAASNPVTRVVANKSKEGSKATNPKAVSEESEPAGAPQPTPTVREEQLPTRLKDTAVRRQVEVESKSLADELASAVDTLTTSVGAPWKDAAYTILDIALLRPRQKIKTVNGKEINVENTQAYEDARDMVLGVGENEELLWGGVHYMDAKKVLLQLITDEVLSKGPGVVADPTFEAHEDLWALAIEHNMFQPALRSVTHPRQKIVSVFPTNPTDEMRLEMPTTYDWGKHGIKVTDDEVTTTIAATAEELSDHGTSYEPVEFDEMEEQSAAEALEDADITDSVLNSWNADSDFDGRGKIFDTNNKEITKPISLGNAKLLVSGIMRKLNAAVRPAHRVYKNVAEMKRKDPALYAKANASRSDKKVIPANAAGYAFKEGGKAYVLLFSDNIKTKQQLAFTVAHEVIGHFGLGSIMPEKNFKKLLDDIYALDGKVRRQADLLAEVRGMDKHEAVEEVLADMAAHLDTSFIVRIANAIKQFLRDLGVNFQDDMTRYFLHHSRRYQRTGETPNASPYAVLREFKLMDSMAGRASAAEYLSTGENVFSAEGGSYHGMPTRIKNMLQRASSVGGVLKTAKHGLSTVARVLENIQSLDNKALRSRPLQELFEIMSMQKQRLEALKTALGVITKWSNNSETLDKAARLAGRTIKDPAPTDINKEHASIVLPLYNRAKADRNTPQHLKDAPDLGKSVGGVFVRNKAGWDASRKRGHMTIEELNKGVWIQVVDLKTGKPAVKRNDKGDVIYYDAAGKETTAVDGDQKPLGTPKKEMEHVPLLDRNGKPFKVDKNTYRLIEEQRLAIDTIAEAVYLDKVNGMAEDKNAEFQDMRDTNKALGAVEIDLLKRVGEMYATLYNEDAKLEGSGMHWKVESKNRARSFIHNITRMMDSSGSAMKRKDWISGPAVDSNDAKTMADFIGSGSHATKVKPLVDEMIALSESMAGKKVTASRVVAAIENMYLLDTQIINAELYAKNTIQTAYVPLKRKGKYQVRMQAFEVDSDGNPTNRPVALPPLLQAQLYYTRMDGRQDAEDKAKEISDVMEGKPPVTVQDHEGNDVKVVFRSVWSVAPQGASLSGSISYDDLASVLVRAGVNISPQDRERLVQLTASEHSIARSNLQKDWTPGWSPNVVHGIAEHLEQQAHIAAKNRHQHKIARLMQSAEHKNDWNGDEGKLTKLQGIFLKLHKAGKNKAAITEAYRAMAKFQWQHISSAPPAGSGVANIKMVHRNGTHTMVLGHGKGEQYEAAAADVISGYHKYQGTPATGDEAFAAQGSWVMSGTAILHLGGALAPALVNMTAIITHSANYLATFNTKTGYGGGHGYNAAFLALQKAGSDLSLLKDGLVDMTGSGENIQAIIDGGAQSLARYNLTLEEAEFLRDITIEGVTTPNIFNALSDVARSGNADGVISKVADKWMLLFAKSEQYNRRVTALASYRLDKARIEEASDGKALTAAQKLDLHNRAADAVNFSQGNYDSFNRPAWAQGNVFKYLWMYKQFQVITVQLMGNLSHADKTKMLVMFVLLSGLKGVPFMDDIWDFIDTLMQKFGIKWAGVEAEMTLLLKDSPIPSALVARGAIDYWFGFTGSSRFSMGDLIPGTGILKAGADIGRELESIAGPVYGAWKGVAASGGTALQYVAEVVGLKDDVTSLSDVLRTGGGFSALKNYARAFTYMADGAITNDRGQVVAKDAGVWDAVAQLVGFYPGAATDQYAVIRMTNDARDYAQAITSAYKDAYNKAGSAKERGEVKRMVQEWNKDSRGTPFYIKNFSGAVSKSNKKAKLTSSGRNLQTVPKAMQKFGKDLLTSRGMSTKGIPLE